MTIDSSEKVFQAEHMLYALNVAIQAVCKHGIKHKEQDEGMFYASAALVLKLEGEVEKAERRLKAAKQDKDFYSLS